MSSVVLDVGAGSLSFAKKLMRENIGYNPLVFCGEPNWKDVCSHDFLGRKFSLPVKMVCKYGARDMIKKGKVGVHRIVSRYDLFTFDDGSLDMVTVNSPHPSYSMEGLEREADRCLKSGGVLYFGHNTNFDLDLPEDFELVAQGTYAERGDLAAGGRLNLARMCENYPSGVPSIVYPSATISGNIKVRERMDKDPNFDTGEKMGHIYNRDTLHPNFKVWVRK